MAASENDAEMRAMAESDAATAVEDLQPIQTELHALLFPEEPTFHLGALLEVKAGVGGEEAALWSGDLIRMYTRLAQRFNWKTDILEQNAAQVSAGLTAGKRAFRSVLMQVDGAGAYGRLRHEIGVHRVQRIPATETQGRIHTSTASVIVRNAFYMPY